MVNQLAKKPKVHYRVRKEKKKKTKKISKEEKEDTET